MDLMEIIIAGSWCAQGPERRPTAAEALESKGLEDAEKILQILS